MKTFLLILFVIVGYVGFGQHDSTLSSFMQQESGYLHRGSLTLSGKLDTLPLTTTAFGRIVQSGVATLSYKGNDSSYTDTISCIEICIDKNTGATSSMGYFHPLDKATNDRRIVYWINGYEVRGITIEGRGSHQSGDFYWYNENPKTNTNHRQYLDENKNPFDTDIQVLISINNYQK